MKKLFLIALAAAGVATAAEIATLDIGGNPQPVPHTAKALALDVTSTDLSRPVTVSVVRVISSYTNCLGIAVVTNGIGEISTVTNRLTVLKETKTLTNALCNATCSGGVGSADVNKFIFGGDKVFATGITNVGETVKVKLVIER